MKAAGLKDIKDELKNSTREELLEHCLRLTRFKKENKELLTYRLFYSYDERDYQMEMKESISNMFSEINTSGFYLMKKGIRKILRFTKQGIRYSDVKETELELLLHFCNELVDLKPSVFHLKVLTNLFETQVKAIEKGITKIEADLRHDYQIELNELLNKIDR